MPLLSAPEHDEPLQLEGFVSADEVPDDLLDPAPSADQEGDDSLPKSTARNIARAMNMAVPLPPKARARIVPLRRQLKYGMRGKDVVATKRALSHAGYLKWPKRWSLVAGPKWRAAVIHFQKWNHLGQDGIYGPATHRALVAAGHYDRWGAKLMAEAPRAKTASKHLKHQDRIEAYALWGYHNRDRLFYLQRRPMHIRSIYELPSWLDCSEFVTRAYKAAGSPDPNDLDYNGLGFTGTLARHGFHGRPEVAALNFYGIYPYKHVTVCVGANRCMSMGSSAGPLLLPIVYRPDYNETRVYQL